MKPIQVEMFPEMVSGQIQQRFFLIKETKIAIYCRDHSAVANCIAELQIEGKAFTISARDFENPQCYFLGYKEYLNAEGYLVIYPAPPVKSGSPIKYNSDRKPARTRVEIEL